MPDLVLSATHLAGSPGDADLLIVGPSLGTSVTALWSECANVLGDKFEVVGWDPPGHGHSDPARGFSVADLADAVVNLAEGSRSEGQRCWYAGVSLGGAVGIELAMRDQPFEAVAVIASAAKVGNQAAWHERAALVRRAGTTVMVDPSSQRWFAPGFAERQPDVATRLLASLTETDRESYAAACEALAEFDLRPRLPDVAVRLLLMPGSKDQVVSVPEAAQTADNAPGAKIQVLEGCGHLPSAEHPTEVAGVLRDFFRPDTPRANHHGH